jgi:FtsP/CotA-like multicopper oxidase with cupredoxin domain
MEPETTRRDFLCGGAAATAGLLAVGTVQTAQGGDEPQKQQPDHKHEHDHQPGPAGPVGSATDRGKLVPGRRAAGQTPIPVETPDIPKLLWKMNNGVKEFHLTCQHTRREFLPDLYIDVWGFNDCMPGPTIEAVEGDRVRIIVHNKLPEATGMHWHGLEVPIAMDGVPGLTQDPIKPGETYVYEFELRQNGTYFYHSHGAMQEGMGMVGLFIIHPKAAYNPPVDRDFALVLQEWAILPGATIPNTASMEFNFFTTNGRSAPYITPMVVRLGDRVRLRLVNFSVIDHHPMHLHGLTFWITGTEAGRIPETAWIPSNNVIVGVAQARDIEFVANNPGDWMLHCHMFHHMMNHMTSMVGMMGGHTRKGMPSGGNMATGMGMITRGPALSEDFGASLGRGTGEQTSNERAVVNGARMAAGQEHAGHGTDKKDMKDMDVKGMDMKGKLVPGYPQDMMEMQMYSPAEIRKLTKPETRGMRADWFMALEGLMTVIRVLPPDLYDKVVSGKGDVSPGASVPGAASGKMPGHEGHGGGAKEEPATKKHEDHKKD